MSDLLHAADRALFLIVALSAIPIAVATLVGLSVALVQAVTHLQEQSLPFGIKLLAVCLCLYLISGWLGSRILGFGDDILTMAFR
ncbi:MAG: EscS/YscS/HrcS family type III secretion system export apparatus protein [Comamonadaceae bacterium]|nr:MAG: EscS/YscS/HrcS family type III secretion system export apparatus protein [Comamonadaceae bacterium]